MRRPGAAAFAAAAVLVCAACSAVPAAPGPPGGRPGATSPDGPPAATGASGAVVAADRRAAALAAALTAGLTPSVPVRDGVTQPVLSYPDAVRERVLVRTGLDRDGDGDLDLVALDIVRPAPTRTGLRVPVVLEASPYFDDVGRGPQGETKTTSADGTPRRFPLAYDNYLVPRGYALALLDLPGTNDSGGCLDYGGPGDVDAAVAAARFLTGDGAAQDAAGRSVRATWSTGAVGLVGKSYDGYMANAVAARAVPGVRTAVAIAAPSTVYDYLTGGGVRVGPGLPRRVRRPEVRAGPGRPARVPVRARRGEADALALPSPFWADRDCGHGPGTSGRPCSSCTGSATATCSPTRRRGGGPRSARRLCPSRMWLLQGGHVDPFDVRRQAWLGALHRWLDHWLQGVGNGVDSVRSSPSRTRRAGGARPRPRRTRRRPRCRSRCRTRPGSACSGAAAPATRTTCSRGCCRPVRARGLGAPAGRAPPAKRRSSCVAARSRRPCGSAGRSAWASGCARRRPTRRCSRRSSTWGGRDARTSRPASTGSRSTGTLRRSASVSRPPATTAASGRCAR